MTLYVLALYMAQVTNEAQEPVTILS